MSSALEQGLIFQGESVRAMLAGRKTQTRRLLKVRRVPSWSVELDAAGKPWPCARQGEEFVRLRCPYGDVGSRLWVRESFMIGPDLQPIYAAERFLLPGSGLRWTSPIFLPRELSRIDLELTAVRLERLHEITEDDARAEGVDGKAWSGSFNLRGPVQGQPHRHGFFVAWDKINGRRASWESNPWVWALGFKVVRKPELGDGIEWRDHRSAP